MTGQLHKLPKTIDTILAPNPAFIVYQQRWLIQPTERLSSINLDLTRFRHNPNQIRLKLEFILEQADVGF